VCVSIAQKCRFRKPLLVETTTTRQQTQASANNKTQQIAQSLRSCCAKGIFGTTTNTKKLSAKRQFHIILIQKPQ
jgi:hypothetical protein